MERGILYVAIGDSHIEEALLSAEQFRTVTDLPITVIADRDIESEFVDDVILLDEPVGGPGDQMEAMAKTPYEETLLLDTDIYVARDPSEVFEVLTQFDIAIAHAPHRKVSDDSPVPEPPTPFPEYNSGVVAYRDCDAVRAFLDSWTEKYAKDVDAGIAHNQPSFRRALYHSDLRIATLPPEYNCRVQFPGQASLPVTIFHGRLKSIQQEWGGMIRLLDIESAAKKINAKSGPRVFYPGVNGVKVHHFADSKLYRLRASVKRDGVLGTLRKIIKR